MPYGVRMAEPNFDNRTLFESNNLPVLRGLNSETIDLIATDPPFNKGRDFHATPDSLASGAKFADRWRWEEDVHDEWCDAIQDEEPAAWSVIEWSRMSYGDDMGAFLCFIGVRLLEMRRVLKPTGSIYLHCDPTASHYLKALMDAVFGRKQFRNEIVWAYTGPGSPKMRQFNRKHDIILWYAKGSEWTFNADAVRVPHKDGGPHSGGFKGTDLKPDDPAYGAKGKIPETWWPNFPTVARFKSIEQGGQRTGYPTQKPLALYDRIIRASSNEGDWVLDPFAGCATTPIAAELAGRKWLAIDLWDGAAEVTRKRLADAIDAEGAVRATRYGEAPEDAESARLPIAGEIHHRTDLPERTDEGGTAAPHLATPTAANAKPLMSKAEIKSRLLAQFGPQCWGCTFAAPTTAHEPAAYLELDHIVPRSDGGSNDIHNRALLCSPCNAAKRHTLTLGGLRKANRVKDHPVNLKSAAAWSNRIYADALAAQRAC